MESSGIIARLKHLPRSLIVRWRLHRRHLGRFNFARRMEWQEVLSSLKPTSTDVVCDIGCGTGTYAHMMARKVRTLQAIDISTHSLHLATGAERPGNCFFECADAERLPFRDGAFDGVFSICAFEHFADDAQALREVKRVLKPGGRVVLTVDSFSYPSGISGAEREQIMQQRHIQRLYRFPQAAAWLRDSGLVPQKARYLVRSPLADQFYRLGSRLGYARSLLFVALFPILYPLAVMSDRLLGSKEGGYTLTITAYKPMSSMQLAEERAEQSRP